MNDLVLLEQVLDREAGLHERLLVAAEAKRQAILKGDLPAMEQLLREEQTLLGEVEREEKSREALAGRARASLGLPADARLAALIEKAGDPLGARLAAVRERLRAALDKLRYRTRQNAELLRASLQHVEAFLRTVLEAGDPDPQYGRDGRRAGAGLHLLDRSA